MLTKATWTEPQAARTSLPRTPPLPCSWDSRCRNSLEAESTAVRLAGTAVLPVTTTLPAMMLSSTVAALGSPVMSDMAEATSCRKASRELDGCSWARSSSGNTKEKLTTASTSFFRASAELAGNGFVSPATPSAGCCCTKAVKSCEPLGSTPLPAVRELLGGILATVGSAANPRKASLISGWSAAAWATSTRRSAASSQRASANSSATR
mmetsp:Transcript_29480/g.83150  ORF Transcript_29480/g.83150 Transcript_29480/m.83150 type:complete len:209 (-) Transcript_29480:935-1561(-)